MNYKRRINITVSEWVARDILEIPEKIPNKRERLGTSDKIEEYIVRGWLQKNNLPSPEQARALRDRLTSGPSQPIPKDKDGVSVFMPREPRSLFCEVVNRHGKPVGVCEVIEEL